MQNRLRQAFILLMGGFIMTNVAFVFFFANIRMVLVYPEWQGAANSVCIIGCLIMWVTEVLVTLVLLGAININKTE